MAELEKKENDVRNSMKNVCEMAFQTKDTYRNCSLA